MNAKQVKIKVILLGDTMVGKTTILERMRSGLYNPDTTATVGASFVMLKHKNITFDIWDTAGQERYVALTSMYFRNVKIVLFVFDINNLNTINSIIKYKDYFDVTCDYKIIVLANKTDLLDKEVKFEDISYVIRNVFESIFLTNKIHGMYFISAKKGCNFDDFLEHLYECSSIIQSNNIDNFYDCYLNIKNVEISDKETNNNEVNDKCC